MSYALVRLVDGAFLVVDTECLSDSHSVGSTVMVYASASDRTTSYEAMLIDFGSREALQRKQLEIRDLSLEEIKQMISNARSSRRNRVSVDMFPIERSKKS